MSTSTASLPERQPFNALAILQTVQNRRFSSLAETSAYLKSLSPEERFEIVNGQATKLVVVQEEGRTSAWNIWRASCRGTTHSKTVWPGIQRSGRR
jgi:hypothetical protein